MYLPHPVALQREFPETEPAKVALEPESEKPE